MISCCVCSKQLKQITRNHLFRHGISVADYKKTYPSAPLQDESIIMRAERNPFFGKHHTEQKREQWRKHFSGKSNPKIAAANVAWWASVHGEKRRHEMQSEDYRNTMSKAVGMWWENATVDEVNLRFEHMRLTNIANGRWLTQNEKEPFNAYRDAVRVLSQKNFHTHFHVIENAELRGNGFDLDHVVSIYDGFMNNVPIELMASVKNLRIISSHDNKVKGRNSHMTPQQLIENSK